MADVHFSILSACVRRNESNPKIPWGDCISEITTSTGTYQVSTHCSSDRVQPRHLLCRTTQRQRRSMSCNLQATWSDVVSRPCKRSRSCYSVVSVLSVCNLCIVAKRSVLPKNCLKKQTGNGLWGKEWSRETLKSQGRDPNTLRAQ